MLGIGLLLRPKPITEAINSATAWYFGANGLAGTPWNDLSRTGLGTRIGPTGLVEYGPHNLLTYSEQLDNAAWNKTGATVTANTPAAPDDTLTASAGSSSHFTNQSLTFAANRNTFSVRATYGNHRWMLLRLFDGTTLFFALFDLQTGVVGVVGGSCTSAITPESGGYRCSISATTVAGAGSVLIGLNNTNTASLETWTAVGTESIQLFGAQLNQGTLTDYVPTTTTARYLPCITYDPVTLASHGLLIEGAGTNLLASTENFSSTWTAANATNTTNTVTSPSGTVTGNTITCSGISSIPGRRQTTSVAINTTYTASAYFKKGDIRYAMLRLIFLNAGGDVYFDLDSGVVASAGAGITTTSMQNVGNGWYRVVATGTTAATITNQLFDLAFMSTNGGVSGVTAGAIIYAWGAQLETGSVATSYIPNAGTGTAVRVADDWYLSGAAVSSILGAGEGTLYLEMRPQAVDRQQAFCSLGDSSSNHITAWLGVGGAPVNNLALWVQTAGVDQAYNYGPTAFTAGQLIKLCIIYGPNKFQLVANGVTQVNDSSGTVPTISRIAIGNYAAGFGTTFMVNGTSSAARYYPTAKTLAEAQALTA
jgi:hypothetical protein